MNTNPSAKRILCFGDSNTWGYVPFTDHERYPPDARWTGVLQLVLGNDYEVIEEGLNSRTLFSEDNRQGKEGRSGNRYLIPCLDTHDPLDLTILMLGTNELKDSFNSSIEKVSSIYEKDFVQVILERKSQFRDTTSKLIIILPPQIDLTKKYARDRYLNSSKKGWNLKKLLKVL